MKKLILSCLMVLFLINSYAQLSVSPTNFEETINVNVPDVSLNSRIENLSNKAIKVNWKRLVTSLPAEWENFICTGMNCYDNLTNSGQFTLEAFGNIKDTTLLLTHFEPYQTPGTAVVQVALTEDGNPSNSVTVTYNINGIVAATKDLSEKNAIALYPNPTTEYFMIRNKANVSKIKISNIAGYQIRTFDTLKERYDISDLNGGMYIVQLLDAKNKIIKTTRLSILRP